MKESSGTHTIKDAVDRLRVRCVGQSKKWFIWGHKLAYMIQNHMCYPDAYLPPIGVSCYRLFTFRCILTASKVRGKSRRGAKGASAPPLPQQEWHSDLTTLQCYKTFQGSLVAAFNEEDYKLYIHNDGKPCL